jgi:SOS-response transcriptional repressor LexA
MNKKENFLKEINDGKLFGAQAKLAKLLRIAQPSVLRWFKDGKEPSREHIKKMAKIFKKPEKEIEHIFGVSDNIPNIIRETAIYETQNVPVLGTTSATKEKFILEEKPEVFLNIKKSHPKCFAIKVEGDCMVDTQDLHHSIFPGDYVIVIPEPAAITNGQVVLARVDKEHSTLKRFYKEGDKIELRPDNPECDKVKFNPDDMEIIGYIDQIHRPATIKKKKERSSSD